MTVPSDIEIAQAATLRPITDVAAEIGLGPDDLARLLAERSSTTTTEGNAR